MINVLHLGLSYACNMRCKHCFVCKKKDNLSTQIIKEVLTTLARDYGLFIVYYTYGEPLLARNFYETVNIANDLGLVQILMSNGTLIDRAEAQKLKQSNISQVYISIDSINPKLHDYNRAYEGAHQKAINAIGFLAEAGVKVGIATTLTDSNVNEIEELWEFATSHNVSVLSLLRERKNGKIVPLGDKESWYLDFVKKHIIDSPQSNLLLHDPTLIPYINYLYKQQLISFDTKDKYVTMNSCHRDTTLSITPNAEVSHCNLCHYLVGNLLDNNISEILNTEEKGEINSENIVCCTTFSR